MAAFASFDEVRTLGFAGISGTYAAVGVPLTENFQIITFTNNTDGDVYFTDDSTVDKIFVAAGSFKLYDLSTNRNPPTQDKFVLKLGTQFYVRDITATTSGAVYIEGIF
jgi:hypothetical protein